MRNDRARQVRELRDSLVRTLFNDPDRLVIALENGSDSYQRALYELAANLYDDGWRKMKTEKEAEGA